VHFGASHNADPALVCAFSGQAQSQDELAHTCKKGEREIRESKIEQENVLQKPPACVWVGVTSCTMCIRS
jgi:hypothetical protein